MRTEMMPTTEPTCESYPPISRSDLMHRLAEALLLIERKAKRAERKARKAQAKSDARWAEAGAVAEELALALPPNINSYHYLNQLSVTRDGSHVAVETGRVYVCGLQKAAKGEG